MENNEKELKELREKLLEYRASLSNMSMAESGEGIEAEYWLQKFDKMFNETLNKYGNTTGRS